MTFGNRLKQARENKGYNQKQFAERLGITLKFPVSSTVCFTGRTCMGGRFVR